MSEPRFIDVRAEPRDDRVLDSVVRHLDRGGLVAHPTETVYGLGSAPREEPVQALLAAKGRGVDKPLLLLIADRGSVDALEWGSDAEGLARAFWPGALTLVLNDPDGRFPRGVRGPSGGVAVRETPHPLARALLHRLGEPVTSTSANLPGGEPARTGREAFRVVKEWGRAERFWVLDGGALPPSPPSTIVDCTASPPSVLREGSIPAWRLRSVLPELLTNLSGFRTGSPPREPEGGEPFRLLFVCTGNTCRSPMAHHIARAALDERGWEHIQVESAGIFAPAGSPASAEAVRAAARRGLDLSAHGSSRLTPERIARAGLVLAMTPEHVRMAEGLGGGGKTVLLADFAGETAGGGFPPEALSIPDPVGGDDLLYEETFELLEDLVRRTLDRLEAVPPP